MYVSRNCNGSHESNFRHVTSLGAAFKQCPKSWLQTEGKEAYNWIEDYYWLKQKNILPKEGGKLNQDPRYIEAVTIIEAEQKTIEEAVRKINNGTNG